MARGAAFMEVMEAKPRGTWGGLECEQKKPSLCTDSRLQLVLPLGAAHKGAKLHYSLSKSPEKAGRYAMTDQAVGQLERQSKQSRLLVRRTDGAAFVGLSPESRIICRTFTALWVKSKRIANGEREHFSSIT
jgi:hypothetical protein